MTRSPTEKLELPVYEDPVRERGDAVAEAQPAASHMQHQASELLGRQDAPQPALHPDTRADAAVGDRPEWRGAVG